MLKLAVILFAISAVGGLIMATTIFKGKLPAWALSLLHAALGATGLVLVLLNVINGGDNAVLTSFILLTIAAVGGFYLASFHKRKKVAPKSVVVIHASVAVIGFLLLVNYVFGGLI